MVLKVSTERHKFNTLEYNKKKGTENLINTIINTKRISGDPFFDFL